MDQQDQPTNEPTFSENKSTTFPEKIKMQANKVLDWIKANPKKAAIRTIGGVILSGFAFVILLTLLIWGGAFGSLPSKQQLKYIENHTASEIYSADEVLLGKYFKENRVNVPLNEISDHFKNALVATEDARFFEHGGIDLRAWVRVFLRTVLLQDEGGGGGSTISQQLAKNIYKRKRYRVLSIPINKIREMFIAKRLESVYAKDELLGLYLNTVPFSRNIYGIQVASKQFFNTTPAEIKVEQAATLVGTLKANTYYDPVKNPDNALKRRNTVLTQMKKYKYITTSECDSLKKIPLVVDYKGENRTKGLATHYRAFIRKLVEDDLEYYHKHDGSSYNLDTDGLKIFTTLDSRMQMYAEQSMKEHLTRLQKDFDNHWKGKKAWGDDKVIFNEMKKTRRYKRLKERGLSEADIKKNFEVKRNMTVFTWKGEMERKMSPMDSLKYYFTLLNSGFLAMEPQSGNVKAWVGGNAFKYFQYDHVIQAKRQVGSTFKPIVYAAALQSGVQPCEYIHNRLVEYTDYENWRPENSDGEYGGVYSMKGALTKSVNSVAVDLIMRAGIDTVRHLAQQMGITSDIPRAPAIALGAVDVSLFDMVKVYGTLANKGLRPEPKFLLRVEDNEGNIIIDYEEDERGSMERVLDEQYALMMTEMMQSVVDSGTARRLRVTYNFTNDIAGKTGTTQSHADGWFIGFTPNLVAGVWVGAESPKVHFRTIRLGQGANTALPVWGKFMTKTLKDKRFQHIKNAKFDDLSVDMEWSMNCPPYLAEEPPEFVEEIIEEVEDDGDPLDRILDVFKNRKKDQQTERDQRKKGPVNVKPGRAEAERKRRERAEELRRKNEKTKKKRERKEKRKKFFDNLFKKNN